MSEEIVVALLLANMATSTAAAAAMWRCIRGMDCRITVLETEHRHFHKEELTA